MEQMILSKNNKQNKKQKQIMAKKSRLGVPRRERGGSGMDGHLSGELGMQIVIFGMDGQWGPTVRHREMCVIESLCSITEPDEIL